MPYNLRKLTNLLFAYQKLTHFPIVRMLLIFVVFSYVTIFLLLQRPATHYLNSKIKLKLLEILIADVKYVEIYNICFILFCDIIGISQRKLFYVRMLDKVLVNKY